MIDDPVNDSVRFIVSRIKRHGGVYLYVARPTNMDDLIRGFATVLPGTCRCLRIDGEVLGPLGEAIVTEALKAGETVILGCTRHSALADFWDVVKAAPQGKALGLIHPPEVRPADSRWDDLRADPDYSCLGNDAAAALEERGRSAAGNVHTLGTELTMPDLSFLRERDRQPGAVASGPHRVDVGEILNDHKRPISWTELVSLITSPLSKEIPLLLLERGQLTQEQFYCYLNARKLLKEAESRLVIAPNGRKIHGNVFDAVWAVVTSGTQYTCFRGQENSAWPLQCTLFRPTHGDHPPDCRTLMWRLQQSNAFLEELRANQQRYLGGTVDDDSPIAIAQHFGMSTHLMDFTRSLYVAAFFATLGNVKQSPGEGQGARTCRECQSAAEQAGQQPPEKRDSGIGAIYCLRTNDDAVIVLGGANDAPVAETAAGLNLRLGLASLGEPLGIRIQDLAGIHFGDYREITPKLPDEENRIRRQHGVFIESYDPRHLNEARMSVYYFRQQPGVVFEYPPAGIDRATLLPDGTGLAQLADSIKKRLPCPHSIPLDPALGSLVMPSPTVIGSMGSLLRIQVDHGTRFFERLRERLDELGADGALGEIREIFIAYFEACRLHAGLGEETPSWENSEPFGGDMLGPALGQAALRLARWAGVHEADLGNALWNELGGAARLHFSDGHPLLEPVLEPTNLRERIALGCGYYLVGWEHLRNVGGFRARNLTWKAEELLHLRQ
jgi:hypothetical protein